MGFTKQKPHYIIAQHAVFVIFLITDFFLKLAYEQKYIVVAQQEQSY